MTLFGFPAPAEAEAFRVVQSVSGIGPRLALSVLAVLSPEDLARAVAAQDTKAITKVPGIGPKVAGRMMLELGGKLAPPADAAPAAGQAAPAAPVDAATEQVVEALVGLGWPEKASATAVEETAAELGGAPEAGELLRGSLRRLGGAR